LIETRENVLSLKSASASRHRMLSDLKGRAEFKSGVSEAAEKEVAELTRLETEVERLRLDEEDVDAGRKREAAVQTEG
jgi:ADP-ribose pyrophosphatase YjhB (NUDIX family)